MRLCHAALILMAGAAYLTGCDRSSSPAPTPVDVVVAPAGFDVRLLEIMACPENLTPLRLARFSEILRVNDRIQSREIRRWNGGSIDRSVDAMLIREDGLVAYEIREGVPIMLIPEALVLDPKVGPPDPDKARTKK